MTAPYYGIERLVESAMKSVIDNVDIDEVPVYIASDTADETDDGEPGIRLPYVMIAGRECRTDIDGVSDGVFEMTVDVTVRTHRHDEPGESHADRVGKIRDALIVDNLASQLSAAQVDLHVFLVRSIQTSQNTSGTEYETTTSVSLVLTSLSE